MRYGGERDFVSLFKPSKQRAIPASETDKSIPRDLSAIVSRCIEPHRRQRYQSAAELLADLESFQPSVGRTSAGVVLIRTPALAGAYRWLAVAVVAVAPLTGGFLAREKFAIGTAAPPRPMTRLVPDVHNPN